MIELLSAGKKRTIKDLKTFGKVIIWGMGSHINEVMSFAENNNLHIVGICDSDIAKHGMQIEGNKIEPPDKIFAECSSDTAIIIGVVSYQYEIGHMLRYEYHVDEKRIFSFTSAFAVEYMYDSEAIFNNEDSIIKTYSILADQQSRDLFIRLLNNRISMSPEYLLPNACQIKPYVYQSSDGVNICPKDGDVIIDAGAYIGDTAEYFISIAGDESRCICVEPLRKNYEVIKKWIKNTGLENRVKAYNLALGDRKGETSIYSSNEISVNASTMIDDNTMHTEHVEIEMLDNLFLDQDRIDLIKFDIEGSEIEAIEGGIKLFEKYTPKLIISAYHRTSHLWEIPLKIRSHFKNSKIYLGHQINAPFEPEYYVVLGWND